MTRLAIGVSIVIVACATGCAGTRVVTGAASTTSPSPAPQYVEQPVTGELRWSSGQLILDPPGTTRPKISAAAAYRATGPTGKSDTARVMFGLFTDTSTGNPTPNGLALTYRKYPAWIIWHRQAEVAPNCAPSRPGTQSTCGGPVVESTLAAVDANTGMPLVLYTFP